MTPQQFADSLVSAFASSQSGPYFAHFSQDATFIFHTTPRRLESRREYEDLWNSWESDDGFRVLTCTSSNQRIQELGDTAVFTHDVETTAFIAGEAQTTHERETIVLQRTGTEWLAIHEHLSSFP